MKRLTLLVLLIGCLIAGSANAQYTTNYQYGFQDITSYATSGTNAWKLLPGNKVCQLKSLAIGAQDASIWCIGTDHYPYSYSMTSKTWTKQTAMGNGVTLVSLIVQNATTLYSLQSTPSCSPQGDLGVYKWSGASGWTFPGPGCLSQLSVGADGYLAGVNHSGQLWNSTNGGTSWNLWSNGWGYVNMWSSNLGCGIDSAKTHIYELNPSQPSISIPATPGSMAGCMIVPNDPAFLAWNTAGSVYLLDFNTVTWKAVAGVTANQLAGVTKSTIFGLDSTGKPYHWNVYAPSITGTISGTWSSFPGMNPAGAPQHTGTIRVKYPHSLDGTQHSQTIPYNHAMNVSSTDINPMCDMVFGPTGDGECQPTTSGTETCSQVGHIGAPDSPPDMLMSVDVESFLAFQPGSPTVELVGNPAGPGGWFGEGFAYTQMACIQGLPSCEHSQPMMVFDENCEFADPVGNVLCEAIISGLTTMIPSMSPWVIITPYFDRQGVPLCMSAGPPIPYNGDWFAVPPCQ